jgi:hypothetical protein
VNVTSWQKGQITGNFTHAHAADGVSDHADVAAGRRGGRSTSTLPSDLQLRRSRCADP